MKKSIIFILVLVFCFSLSACGCKHEWDSKTGKCKICGEECSHEWNAKKGKCSVCGLECRHEHGTSESVPCSICGYTFESVITNDVIGAETTFYRFPAFWSNTDCPEQGTIETLNYQTSVYDEVYDKYVLVYLPYGYDPADTSKKYNVVYFQHGNNSTIDIIMTGKCLKEIDNKFYYTDIEPVIIVDTTFYDAMNSAGPAADYFEEGSGEFIFDREIINDILPAVESHYNTYAASGSKEDLIASRDHRAFTGYSRGGMCTWNVLNTCFEYFKWYSPMSGNDRGPGGSWTDEDSFNRIRNTIESHSDLDYFIFAASGGSEDAVALRQQMAYYMSQNYFSYGKDPSANNLYYSLADYNHGDPWTPHYYYNSLQVFFK